MNDKTLTFKVVVRNVESHDAEDLMRILTKTLTAYGYTSSGVYVVANSKES